MKKLFVGGLVAASLIVLPQTASASILSDFFSTIFGGGGAKVTQSSAPIVSNINFQRGTLTTNTNTEARIQQFTLQYSVTAGTNPAYISTDAYTAITAITNLDKGDLTVLNFSDNDTSGDGSNYFYIAPGQTKVFSISYMSSSGVTIGVTASVDPLGVKYGTFNTNMTTGSTTQQFQFSFNITADKNPVFVSKNQESALATAINSGGIKISAVNFSDEDTTGDGAGYFYVAPGQTKKFTAVYSASGLNSNSGVFQVKAVKYGASSSNTTGSSATQIGIQNSLKAVLFH